MMNLRIFPKTISFFQVSVYIFILLTLFSRIKAQSDEVIHLTRQDAPVTIVSSSRHFNFELNYPKAFDAYVNHTKYGENDNGDASFCEATFDQISPKAEWQGLIHFPNDHSFVNILSDKEYIYILDSISLNVLATKDMKTSKPPFVIGSDFSNNGQGNSLEETFFTIDTEYNVLYIVTKTQLLSYPLSDFYEAVNNGKPIPKISKFAQKYQGHSSITTVKHYLNNLYIVADNNVHVLFCASNGDVVKVKVFDQDFFKVENPLSIVDISFQDQYAFVLDSLNGVYVVDVSRSKQQLFSNLGLLIKIGKGQFVEAAGQSLNIITSSAKSTFLYEYAIEKDIDGLKLEISRQSELYQSVIGVRSDKTFLYIVTGFFNVVLRHSIPGFFDTKSVEDALYDFWPLYKVSAFNVVERDSKSGLVIIRYDALAFFSFEKNPILVCDMTTVADGQYTANLVIKENTCPEKEADPNRNDFVTICQTEQKLILLVANDSSVIGDVGWSRAATIGLIIGLITLVILILVFFCLFRKYKNRFDRLQTKIKFTKLKNLPEGSNEQKKSDLSMQENEANEKKESADRAGKNTGGTDFQNFQNWGPAENKKESYQDFADFKPLDFDQIYADVKDKK